MSISETNVQLFYSDEFNTLRCWKNDAGEPEIMASDVARVLGYRKGSDMLRVIDEDEKVYHDPQNPSSEMAQIVRPTNNKGFYTLTEEGFYSAIMQRQAGYINDEAARSQVKRFQRWVTHDVLPSIRKDGAYVAANGSESEEELIARALIAAQKALERSKADLNTANKRLEETEPKAGFFDACMVGDKWTSVTEVARQLHQYDQRISKTRLFTLLKADGMLTRDNQATKLAIDRGYLMNYQAAPYVDSRGIEQRPKPYGKFTAKGIKWAVKRYCNKEVA